MRPRLLVIPGLDGDPGLLASASGGLYQACRPVWFDHRLDDGSGGIERIRMDKATFDRMHQENRMAYDKLKEGIEGFAKSLEELEQLLAKRVSELKEVAA